MSRFRYLLNLRCALACLWLTISMSYAENSRAFEVLTLHELVVHCEQLDAKPDSIDGAYCLRYIQGFIDGAIETDTRILKSLTNDSKGGFTERATRTRIPGRSSSDRPGELAGFCLDDSLPLRDVVNTVVADLIVLDKREKSTTLARVAVDDSLRQHYPCRK